YSPEPVASAFSNEPAQLLLWADANSICHVYVLGVDRKNSRTFFYAYIGTLGQFAVRIMRGESYPRIVEYLIWGGAFTTTVLLIVVLGRVAYKAIQTSTPKPSHRTPANHLQHRIVSQ